VLGSYAAGRHPHKAPAGRDGESAESFISQCKVTIVPCQQTGSDSLDQNGEEFGLEHRYDCPQMAFQMLLLSETHLRNVR
jgi:hypothetical protein